MPEFSQNCLDCTTNSLSNLNVDNSSCNTSYLELLAAFLFVHLASGGVGIKLFGVISKADCKSLGLEFHFIFKTGKPGGNCLTHTTVFGLSCIFSL